MDSITPSLRAFGEAGRGLGFKFIDDFNAAEQHGIGPYPLDVIDGVRQNTGITYLTEEVRRRPNVTIRSDAQVDRVLFENGHAVGVRLVDGSSERAAHTILCAGVYGSPAILLRSGIGPAQDLRALGIPVVADAPVGRRLMDHPFSFNIYALVPQAREMEPAAGAILWTNSQEAAPGALDVQISPTHFFDPSQSPTGGAIALRVPSPRPASIGTLALSSRDPRQAPRIQLTFLAEAREPPRLLDRVQLARRLGKTRPFPELVERQLAHGP